MGRPKTIDDQDILRHAREAFREAGHAASTREIARAAGISQAVLYQRFGSKEDLFFKAMTPEPADLDALLGPYPPRAARSDLERIAERLVVFFSSLMPTVLHVLAHPSLGRARLVRWHEGLPFLPVREALEARLRRLRADGLIGPIDPAAASMAFIAAVHSVAILELMSGGSVGDRRRQLRPLVATLWQGFRPSSGNTD
jgi:AcrR family transcriptional regulator